MKSSKSVLILRVTNTADIDSGCTAYFIFDRNGGTLGSGENNHWIIQDNDKSISPDQARIEFRDNHYCLQVTSKKGLSINGALMNDQSGFIRLNKADIIHVGNIQIKVYIENEDNIDLNNLNLEPAEIVGMKDYLKDFLGDKQHYSFNQSKTQTETLNDHINIDPISALEKDNDLVTSTLVEDAERNSKTYSHSNKGLNMTSSHFMDLPQSENKQQSEYIENAYVTISPLLREMESNIPLNNSQDINDILSEIGKTLKATIDGLLRLQQAQNSLSDKHLRPIEDNPLRLNLDYAATIAILFGDQKSPVHLAAPAAVSECLSNLLIHNEANKVAIIAALTTILQAFSPEMLLSRFENYRRSNEKENMDPAWAWKMYENYYKELTSTRQQGFEKLFWEVYEQAYDKSLREHKNK